MPNIKNSFFNDNLIKDRLSLNIYQRTMTIFRPFLNCNVYWVLKFLLTDRQNGLQHHPLSSSSHSATFNIIKSFIKICERKKV